MLKNTSGDIPLVMGASLATGNRGVSALGVSLVTMLREATGGADVGMLVGNRLSSPFRVTIAGKPVEVPVVNYRLSPKALGPDHLTWIMFAAMLFRVFPIRRLRRYIMDWTPWISACVHAPFVGDIRGGDSFSDIYGLRRYLEGCLPVIAVLWTRGHIALLPQTYGPYKSVLSRWLARYIIRRASVVVSRDIESIALIHELCGDSTPVRFCPDVAFALEAVRPMRPAIDPPLPLERRGCVIGLNVNGLVYNGGYTRSGMFNLRLDYRTLLLEMIQALMTSSEHRLLLVPHTFGARDGVESDPTASQKLMDEVPLKLRDRIHLVTDEYDQNHIKGVIGLCDFFVGSRMHACIAALSQGIPTIGIAYSKKFEGVFKSVGADECVVDARSASNAEAMETILALYGERHRLRQNLQGRIAATQARLRETIQIILQAEKGQYEG